MAWHQCRCPPPVHAATAAAATAAPPPPWVTQARPPCRPPQRAPPSWRHDAAAPPARGGVGGQTQATHPHPRAAGGGSGGSDRGGGAEFFIPHASFLPPVRPVTAATALMGARPPGRRRAGAARPAAITGNADQARHLDLPDSVSMGPHRRWDVCVIILLNCDKCDDEVENLAGGRRTPTLSV